MTTPRENEANHTRGPFWRALASIGQARRSLSGKLMLIMLVTTIIALASAGAALLFTDLRDNRAGWADDIATEGAIISQAVQPALSFDDAAGAQRILSALQARSSVNSAALYRPDGSLFAEYIRKGHEAPPAREPLAEHGIYIDSGRVELVRQVVQGDEVLGTIYLHAQYDVSARVRAYLSVLAAVSGLGLIASLLASSWLHHVVSRPMKSMANVARQIVQERNYSFRADKISDDEIGVVVDAFNKMLDEVQAHARALETSEKLYRAIGESINYGVWVCDADGKNIYTSDSLLKLVGLTQQEAAEFGWGRALHPDDAAETIAAWKECTRTGNTWYREHRMLGVDGHYHSILAQGVAIRDDHGRIQRWAGINLDISRMKNTERALIAADRRKDEFLATLAHELRNPLAPIRNAVRILGAENADERQRKWGREVIARQVSRMSLLLDDLLDVSRITRGQLELKKDFVDLKAVVSVALETARPLIDAKQHQVSVHLPPENLRLEVDSLRLSQVIGNLLTNAAKYTDPAGQITLSARIESNELVIRIKDSGIGLAPDAIPGLFTIFSQVNSAVDRAEGGLGIGLALVKGLIALHGGRVDVRSEGLGRGSEFIIYLPPDVIAGKDAASAPPRVSGDSPAAPRRAKILVADDNRDAAESLALVLRFSGYEVFIAFSGAEALATCSRERPDAAFVDIGMPGMSGHEVARRIRAESWGKSMVLLALTGWGQEQDRQAALAAGFDEHLTKPVDPENVEHLLQDMLRNVSGEAPAAQTSDIANNA